MISSSRRAMRPDSSLVISDDDAVRTWRLALDHAGAEIAQLDSCL